MEGDLNHEIVLILLPLEIPYDYLSRLHSKHPSIQIRWHNMRADTRVLSPADLPVSTFDGVTILCTQRLPEAVLVPKVHYVQLSAAGSDRFATHPLFVDPKVSVCTANGVHPPQIAEWVIGTWLMHQHHFLRYSAQQRAHYWPAEYERTDVDVLDSPGQRMGILGYGAIGRQCARVGKAMGMHVVAFTRSERITPESRKDESYRLPGTGDPEGEIPAQWFHGPTRRNVNHFLAQDLDLLVLCLPLTESTQHILDSEQFDILSRKKTFVANIARGKHINTEALVEALETGKIRGAALDVTDPEPLPQDHPLWDAPNLFITPHVSWHTPQYYHRVLDILEHNLERMSRGERLLNVVDKENS